MAHVVRVFDNRIGYVIQVGDGGRWIRTQAWEVRRLAVILAPSRTNRLKASHVVNQNRDRYTGRFQKGFTVSATAYHASFVALGTGIHGPLHRKIVKKKAMRIMDGRRPRFIRSSRGQRPNPWLERAAEMALRV